MGLFKCRLCGKVFTTDRQSIKNNLCVECFMKLEDLYSRSGIHNYIRDHGLDEDFDVEELAKEIKMNPRSVELLYNLGFFDRDIQVYTQNSKRKELAREFKNELERIKHPQTLEEMQVKINSPIKKFVTYGGKLYKRKRLYDN